MNRLISAVFLFALLMFFSAVTVEARTLQAGRAYTFSNSDRHTAVFVTVMGSASYEYVMRDAGGRVLSFGSGVGRFQVPAGGETTVQVLGSRTVSFPARVSVRNADVPLLRRVEVAAGRSVIIENTNTAENRRLVTNGNTRYDLIVTDRHGQAAQVAEGLIFSNITVPAGGSAVIYAAERLSLSFPSEWDDLTQRNAPGGAVLTSRVVQPGETISITNNSSSIFTFRRQDAESIIDFTYDLQVYTDVIFAEQTIEPGNTWTLTVQRGQPLSLLFPSEWLMQGLEIAGEASPAVQGITVAPGQSLRLGNADTEEVFDIIIESAVPGVDLQYDYVLQSPLDVVYGMASDAGLRSLPPGAVLTVSPVGHGALRVVLPTAWDAVSAETVSTPAVYYREIAYGESLALTNMSAAEFRHITWEGRGVLDYISRGESGRITAFGVTEAEAVRELAPEESVEITNREQSALRVFFPYEWLDSSVSVSEPATPVLYRQTVRPGGTLEITSSNQRYDRHALVTHATIPMSRVPEYHFVLRGNRDVLDFGVSQDDFVPLISQGRTLIAPARGTAIAVAVPSEWIGRQMSFSESEEQPLHREVIRPGSRLRLENRTSTDLTVQVNGRYFLVRREDARTGDLTIAAREQVTVTAAPGADVEIIMPAEWRSRLLR